VVVGIFPPILKNKNKIKRIEWNRTGKLHIYFIITLNKAGGGLLVFFEDELTTFRNKNYKFICKG